MYSYEIKKYIELKQGLLEAKEYLNIIDTSPQINHIKYENNEFNLYTNDNYDFKIKVLGNNSSTF